MAKRVLLQRVRAGGTLHKIERTQNWMDFELKHRGKGEKQKKNKEQVNDDEDTQGKNWMR